MNKHTVKEAGKNGTVEVYADRIIRTMKRTFGKDDVQTIPIRAVTAVTLNRRTFGASEVTVTVGAMHYVWKSSTAEALANQINAGVLT